MEARAIININTYMNNEYKTVCDFCYQGTWYETEQPCKRTIWTGCSKCGSHEKISKQRPCPGTLRVIDRSRLDSQLDRFYKSGERIEITYRGGDKIRCYVGKSTGWRPVYLEISRSNSSGGGSILSDMIESIRPLGKYR